MIIEEKKQLIGRGRVAIQEETQLKIKVMAMLKSIPLLWCYKVEAGAIAGTPDIIGVVNARFFALELKTETGRVSKIQRHKLRQIDKSGGYARVLRPSNLDAIINDLHLIAGGKAVDGL